MSYLQWRVAVRLIVLALTLAQIGNGSPAATVDSHFNPSFGRISAYAGSWPQTNGQVLVCNAGNSINYGFNAINGSPAKGLVRLNADGSRDTTFARGVGPYITARAMGFGTNGSIVVAGYLNAGKTKKTVFRLRRDGSYDPSFQSHLYGSMTLVVVQPDGKVLLQPYPFSFSHPSLFRLNADGSEDSSFAFVPPDNLSVTQIIQQPDGKLLVGLRNLVSPWETSQTVVLRLNDDGSRDDSFNFDSGIVSPFAAMTQSPDGRLFIAQNNSISEVTSNGAIVQTFFTPTYGSGFLSLQGQDRLVRVNGFTINRFTLEGVLDDSFSQPSWTSPFIDNFNVLKNGKMMVSGWFTDAQNRHFTLQRLNADGTRDRSFLPRIEQNGMPQFVKGLSSGKLLVAGNFLTVDGVPRHGVARLSANGALDTAYHPTLPTTDVWSASINNRGDALIYAYTPYLVTADGTVRTDNLGLNPVAVENDGSVLGKYYNDQVYRITPQGQYDTAFTQNCGFLNGGVDFLPTSDAKILVTLWEWHDDWTVQKRIFRLNHNGTLDTTFGALTNVSVLHEHAGQVFFTRYNSNGTSDLYRVDKSGSVKRVFSSETIFSFFNDMTVDDLGRITATGTFYNPAGGKTRTVIRILPDGSVDPAFNISPQYAFYITQLTDKRLVITGSFTQVNGYSRANIVCIDPDGGFGLPIP